MTLVSACELSMNELHEAFTSVLLRIQEHNSENSCSGRKIPYENVISLQNNDWSSVVEKRTLLCLRVKFSNKTKRHDK